MVNLILNIDKERFSVISELVFDKSLRENLWVIDLERVI